MFSFGILSIAFINLFIISLIYYNFWFKRKGLPPGPTPLPLIGNCLEIFRNQPGEECFIQWSKQYGPIYTFWMGERPFVIMTDYSKIIETFQKDGETYSGRMTIDNLNVMLNGGRFGVVHTDGDLWRVSRRFALQVFRDFGLGKNLMQEKILTEIASRFNALDAQIETSNEEVRITDMIDLTIGSIINSMLFGYRFDGEHLAKFFELKEVVALFMQRISKPLYHLLQWKPKFFMHFPGFRSTYEEARNRLALLRNFYQQEIEKHCNEIVLDDTDAPSTDFVEAFLKEKARRELQGELTEAFTMQQLIIMCFEFWVAGQETTSTTLAWGIAYLIHYPEYQKKMQAELDRVIGATDRFVTVSDRPNLPYTCAVINEFSRAANIVPANFPHITTRDTVIDNFFLPKGTAVVPQISAILWDEKCFENPKQFNPDRFIDNNGQLKRCDELIQFSVGKRQCLGEALARMELFLVTANLFNQYTISRGKELPSMTRRMGITVPCPKFQCIVKKRTPS